MTSLMQQALGADWHRLPPALQAHYADGDTLDIGHLDIEFPAVLQPMVVVLSWLGALVRRRGRAVPTRVRKRMAGQRQFWQRRLCFADGQVLRFDTRWELTPEGHLLEFVNPVLGLQMQPFVQGQTLHYRGVRFIMRLGRWQFGMPEGLVLGHTTIVEQALDERRFAMDFRLTHPLFGQVFRYAGVFEATVP